MSLHRDDSELVRINARAAAQAVEVSVELFEVITLAQRIAAKTEGSFDVTIRPVAELWGFIWKEHRMPRPSELSNALQTVSHRFVELDATRRTVRFTRPGVSMDLGGIAKGYAVDRALARLRDYGVKNAMVRAGGDLRVMGAPPGRTSWEVLLEDPTKSGRRISVPLRDAALSTSGNYENFFEVDGRRYSHLLNPRTGLPVEGVAACTVIAPTSMESDAWATALFVLGSEESLRRFGEGLAFRMTLMPTVAGEPVGPVLESPAWRRAAGPWIAMSFRRFAD